MNDYFLHLTKISAAKFNALVKTFPSVESEYLAPEKCGRIVADVDVLDEIQTEALARGLNVEMVEA